MSTRVLPEFASEAEEARWWFEHDDELTEDFERARQEGTLGHGTTARKAGIPTTTIRLDPQDISMARVQAKSVV